MLDTLESIKSEIGNILVNNGYLHSKYDLVLATYEVEDVSGNKYSGYKVNSYYVSRIFKLDDDIHEDFEDISPPLSNRWEGDGGSIIESARNVLYEVKKSIDSEDDEWFEDFESKYL